MGVKLHRGFESRPLRPGQMTLGTCRCGRLRGSGGRGSVEAMAERMPIGRAQDPQGEQVRKLRLQADGRRPLAVNLQETISLTRKLFELRDAARRAR
jgi:hypothetical protein